MVTPSGKGPSPAACITHAVLALHPCQYCVLNLSPCDEKSRAEQLAHFSIIFKQRIRTSQCAHGIYGQINAHWVSAQSEMEH